MITFKLITERGTLFLKINCSEHLLSVENKAAGLAGRRKVKQK